MKQSHADIFCLDEDGWCLARRVLFRFFFSLPRLFCLASPESRYVFGQLPSYLLLHSNCHRALLPTQPCFSLPCALTSGEEGSSASHSPECYTHIYLFLFLWQWVITGLLSQAKNGHFSHFWSVLRKIVSNPLLVYPHCSILECLLTQLVLFLFFLKLALKTARSSTQGSWSLNTVQLQSNQATPELASQQRNTLNVNTTILALLREPNFVEDTKIRSCCAITEVLNCYPPSLPQFRSTPFLILAVQYYSKSIIVISSPISLLATCFKSLYCPPCLFLISHISNEKHCFALMFSKLYHQWVQTNRRDFHTQ